MSDSILGHFKVGSKVVIRAIPYHYIGTIEDIGYHSLTLAPGAVWLADSGRWMNFLESGNPNECEPFPDGVTIPFSVIADLTTWRHAIPTQK
jgi:hypothetical protein